MAGDNPCGSGLAREGGVTVNIHAEGYDLFASKLAPTGDLHWIQVLCLTAATKKATFSGRLFHWTQELLTAVDLIKDPAIIEVGLLHSSPVTKGLLH